uniref:Uncharacterized protein n=1 Tax=Lepeophtheirus salmonis TaxID=72036 RepID=A0A0K2UVU5_LEPSM
MEGLKKRVVLYFESKEMILASDCLYEFKVEFLKEREHRN